MYKERVSLQTPDSLDVPYTVQ